MKFFSLSTLSAADIETICKRPTFRDESFMTTVRSILEAVKNLGDKALFEFTEKFDGVRLSSFTINPKAIELSGKKVSTAFQKAVRVAAKNIEKFHKSQVQNEPIVETMRGVKCWRVQKPIERVGLYIPGGTAVLPSTVLMLGIPARLAGCEKIILCTPPRKDGSVAPEILFAAKVCGISEVYCIGGAQAIAAMAYGTASIPKVDRIFGPGNQYVTMAKILVAQDPDARMSIDMPAGPSEVLVIAEKGANPRFIAADLLSQAEHGKDSQVVFVTMEKALIEPVKEEISRQLELLPRKTIAGQALEKSLIILADSKTEAMSFCNAYAPEHLILQVEKPRKWLPLVKNVGSVFLGPWSPESAGDYASGTNHTLPTGGYAKNVSGVSMDFFVKKMTVQELTKQGLKNLQKTIETIAEAEGLQAHKNAVSIRFDSTL